MYKSGELNERGVPKLLHGIESKEQWGDRRDWYTHIPKLTIDIINGEVPFEFHEIAALVARTPFFNYST